MKTKRCSSINDNAITVSHKPMVKQYETDGKDVLTLIKEYKVKIVEELKDQMKKLKAIKWYIAVFVQFSKTINGEEVTTTACFHGKTRALLQADNINEQFMQAVDKILESVAKYTQYGSGWKLKIVDRIDLAMVRYQPLFASSYIPTPKVISNSKQGVINIRNEDQKCFLWSVLAALFPDKTRNNRVSYFKKYESKLCMSGIDYPVKITDLESFEDMNPNISVNVLSFENEEVCPLRITKLKDRNHHINLLLLRNESGNTHYCLISNLSKFMSHMTKHNGVGYFCNFCLHRFTRADLLANHTENCNADVQSIDLTKNMAKQISSFIPTPVNLRHHKKSVINVKNLTDEKCFLWSILAALHENKISKYDIEYLKQFENQLNMNGITYPVTNMRDVSTFEHQNTEISINIFGFEKNEIYPIRLTKEKYRKVHVNLLMITNEKGKTHYCFVSNISSLLASLTKHNAKGHYCMYCLHRFASEEGLNKHIPLCEPHGAQTTQLPTEENKWLYFKNYTLTHKVPFTIYCDLESFIVPLDTCEDSSEQPYTMNTAKHIPSGFCFVIIDREGNVFKHPQVYSGPNVIETLLNSLIEESQEILSHIYKIKPISWTEVDKRNFEEANTCHLCLKPLENDKVANHDHLSGMFLGAAHNSCNLNYQVPKHIPVFFHNLKGYDCHHLIQGFGKFKKEKISCIATSSERYISLSIDSLRFLDSLQFLNLSLEKLVYNLAAVGPSKFQILQQCLGNSHIDLLLRKGVYPYEYMTDEAKFTETQLPPRDAFFNKLTDSAISTEDYNHAQNIWDTFGMTCLKDFHDFYLLTDVLLLADVFENFRATSLLYYGIDPCNCYSSPGLAWNAMLKMTDIRLELLTDIDQHLFIEKGVRGGVAMIPNRYAKANNSHLPEYNENAPTSHLIFLDCNSLYATSMCQPLPTSDFKWLTEAQLEELDIGQVSDDNELGYILEVDLEYPESLHDLHSDYPVAPEKQYVTEEMLSPYSKNLLNDLDLHPTNTDKLLTTLNNKKSYILHYRNLKLYLQLGLQLTKIHRALSFKQKTWMKNFIQFNIDKRKKSKNNFEKCFFKFMNNSVYGKSMENVRSRIDFKLVTNEKQLLKWTASPRLQNFFTYNEDLVGLTLKKQSIFLNKPVYLGLAVLELSKLFMYDFHYNWAVAKYGKRVKLCMTDTDSLLYFIETEDVYADIKENLHLFDTSDFPKEHKCYSETNKKELGKFKDERNGNRVKEFIGLRAKCYSILDHDDSEKNVAKGVPRVAIANQLQHSLYKKCLFHNSLKHTVSHNIRSERHQLYTQKISKLSLSPFDDKRYILENGVDTLSYGHFRIKQLQKKEDEEIVNTSEDRNVRKRKHSNEELYEKASKYRALQ